MKKYILMLLALGMVLIPSVAYADTAEVAMVEVAEETPILDTLTEEMLKAKNEALEKEFAEKHPELYEAMKRTVDTPYGFNLNMNVIANIDYPETEEVATFDLRRVFAQLYMNGYINMPAEEMEMKMNIDVDAGSMMQQAFEGFKIIMKDDMMYTFNPMYAMWDSQSVESADMYGVAGNPMEQNNIGLMAPVADLMTKRESLNGTVYSLRMSDEDIEQLVDEYVGMPVYNELITELEETGVSFEIPKIETDYVIQDGVVRVQHSEIDMTLTAEGMTINLIIALDGEYYSYGLQKVIEAPELEVLEETPVIDEL